MDEFIGQKVRCEYVQEVGWKRPTRLTFAGRSHDVEEVLDRWEEHTLGRPWYSRKHRVWYLVRLDDGGRYELYWDRGAKARGKDWILLKRLAEDSPDDRTHRDSPD